MSTFRGKITTIALAASIALISGTAAAERGVTDTSIKIGNIGPFSGKAAMFNPLNYGSVAYMRYINDMGGVYGRKFDIKLGDTACAQAKGIAAAKRWSTTKRFS
jgi:branched-chain amino acid transport system substrate-binding protein